MAFEGDIKLVSLVEHGDILLNVYGVIAINPEKHQYTNITMANNFINFLISEEAQQIIAEYGVDKYERPLFYPLSGGACKELYGCPTWEECSTPATYEEGSRHAPTPSPSTAVVEFQPPMIKFC